MFILKKKSFSAILHPLLQFSSCIFSNMSIVLLCFITVKWCSKHCMCNKLSTCNIGIWICSCRGGFICAGGFICVLFGRALCRFIYRARTLIIVLRQIVRDMCPFRLQQCLKYGNTGAYIHSYMDTMPVVHTQDTNIIIYITRIISILSFCSW